jgi:tRNA A37 threonylcarbamoyladenosine biosynthesis protein TsaE
MRFFFCNFFLSTAELDVMRKKGSKVEIGTLILFSGKMGAGKSTKSKQVSQDRNAKRYGTSKKILKNRPE